MNINTARGPFFRRWFIHLLSLAIVLIAVKPGLANAQDKGKVVPDNVFAAVQHVAKGLETLRVKTQSHKTQVGNTLLI